MRRRADRKKVRARDDKIAIGLSGASRNERKVFPEEIFLWGRRLQARCRP